MPNFETIKRGRPILLLRRQVSLEFQSHPTSKLSSVLHRSTKRYVIETILLYLKTIQFQFRKDSVTVKFGHVIFFWNRNRSGCFNPMLEEYVEIPSDVGITFNQVPKIKALEIAEKAKKAILSRRFDQYMILMLCSSINGELLNIV
ncbi:hypothetical protein ACOSP7_015490 [Xanthoceras sorbifolium]